MKGSKMGEYRPKPNSKTITTRELVCPYCGNKDMILKIEVGVMICADKHMWNIPEGSWITWQGTQPVIGYYE